MSLFKGSAVLLELGREGLGFFLRVCGDFFWLFFSKNSTINIEFGTHLQKTAQPTNTEGRGQFIPKRKTKGDKGEHKEERRGEGSPVVILLLAQSGRDRGNTHPRQGDGP